MGICYKNFLNFSWQIGEKEKIKKKAMQTRMIQNLKMS
jgi:hypothetical protein